MRSMASRTTDPADVADFGAIGDGVADDTDAIQNAVNSKRGLVRFGAGVYRTTRPIVVDLDAAGPVCLDGQGVARLRMAGSGPAIRIVGTHFRSADPKGYEPRVWERQRMPIVERLFIEGAHADSDGVEAVGTMQLTLSRLHIRNTRHAVRLVENNRNVLIADCHLYENRGVGVFYDRVNLHQSNITGCHISYNAEGGIVSRGGNVRNIHVTGCDLESNMSETTAPTANILIDCRESVYGTAEVAITGCTIQHNNPSPDSANIRIFGGSLPMSDGQPVREGNIAITGNVLSDVQVNIHLVECRGVAITGNTLWQGYRENLRFENCSHLVIGSNNLDRNPRYAYGNTADANNAVVFRACDDSTISGLHVSNVRRTEAGVLFENCRRMNKNGCTVLDCDGPGMLLRGVNDSTVTACLVHDARPGAAAPAIARVDCANLTIDGMLEEPARND